MSIKRNFSLTTLFRGKFLHSLVAPRKNFAKSCFADTGTYMYIKISSPSQVYANFSLLTNPVQFRHVYVLCNGTVCIICIDNVSSSLSRLRINTGIFYALFVLSGVLVTCMYVNIYVYRYMAVGIIHIHILKCDL